MAVARNSLQARQDKEVINEEKLQSLEEKRTDALEMEKEEDEAKEKSTENEAEVTEI